MEVFRNRWGYACLAAIVAGAFILGYNIIQDNFDLLSLLTWSSSGMVCAAIAASTFWPKNNKPRMRFMFIAGLAVPLSVIAFLSVIYSILNPGFPDAMVDGIETNPFAVLDGATVMFIVFSIGTFFMPYMVGILLSKLFVVSDN